MDDWQPLLNTHQDSPSAITETYDPSWMYNFKWGVQGSDGRTDVWSVAGGIDGKPVHRAELRKLWGREPQIRDGDRLGMAQYIPAERKLDGSLVAPPIILVHPYYSEPTPPSVIEWFEREFPNTVVRDAQTTFDMKGRPVKLANDDWAPRPMPEMLKWIWSKNGAILIWPTNKDNLPNHDQKAMQEWNRVTDDRDWLGYAYLKGDEVDIDPIRYGTPAQGIAAIKAELAKMFPDKKIVTDQDLAEQYGFEFHGSPEKIARREAAANWAQEYLSETPLEASVSDSLTTERETGSPGASQRIKAGLKRLFTESPFFTATVKKGQTVKKADADMDGAMVGLFIPEETGKKLKLDGGEPLENLHITLLYFEDKAKDRDDWDEVKRIVEQVANQTPALTGKVSGYGVFSNDVDVLWASPSIQGLAELRHKLFEACEDAGFTVSKTHDWAPHITLKYDFDGKLPKLDGEVKLDFPELTFARGNDRDDFKFEGHFEKKAMAFSPEDWDRVQRWTPYLYHATNADKAARILQEGLKPATDLGSSRDTGFLVPRPGHVYLFADPNHAMESGRYLDLSEPVLLRVPTASLDPTRLKADEDYLYNNAYIPEWYNEDNSEEFSDYGYGEPPTPHGRYPGSLGEWAQQQGLDSPNVTYDSYARNNTLAHEGVIPPNLIELAPESPRAERVHMYASWEADEWSGWNGPWRWVTDGKEILKDAAHPFPHTLDDAHVDLTDKFRTYYPESGEVAYGWALPTADGLGYGIHSPSAGYGSEDAPRLNDVIAVLNKELGKPTHMIDEWTPGAYEGQNDVGIS